MSVTNIEEARAKKEGCAICNQIHAKSGKCKRGDLVKKIQNLVRANALIPQLMGSNKEAVEIAEKLQKQVDGLQEMAKRFDEAHKILMDVLTGHGEIGEEIKKKYLGELDIWVVQHTSPDTSETAETSNQENSTLQEMPIKNYTKQQNGLAFAEGSSNTIPSAIVAAKNQQSSITLNQAKDE